MKKGIVLLAALCIIVTGINAQKTTKPWTEWSEKEARQMLDSSPWGKTQDSNDNLNRNAPPLTVNDTRNIDSFGVTSLLTAKMHVRLLSAQPIRQAFARVILLKQKASTPELEKQLLSFVDRKFDDWIVIAVDYEPAQHGDPGALRNAFANATTNTLKQHTYLETKAGQRLFLAEYKAPMGDGLGAKFLFPRMVNGKPFITADAREVRFFSEISKYSALNVRFTPAEMNYGGTVEF